MGMSKPLLQSKVGQSLLDRGEGFDPTGTRLKLHLAQRADTRAQWKNHTRRTER